MKKILILLAGCLMGASAFASCYLVMDAKGNVISRSPNPPVDMSRQLHETVPQKYGKTATLSFGLAETDCGEKADTWNDGLVQPKAAPKAKRAAHRRRARRRPARRAPAQKQAQAQTAQRQPAPQTQAAQTQLAQPQVQQPAATPAPAPAPQPAQPQQPRK